MVDLLPHLTSTRFHFEMLYIIKEDDIIGEVYPILQK